MEEITLLDSFHLEEFVAIDLETTGLDPTTESIIEISAVKFIDGIEKETFSHLIDPGKLISPFIEDLTGITNQMVQGKPQFSDVIDDFIIFIGDSPIVGHNVDFDINFISIHSDGRYNLYASNVVNDTYLLSKLILCSNSNFSLESISDYYGFSTEGAHRATNDAINSGKVLIQLIQDYAEMPKKLRKQLNLIYNGSQRSLPNHHIILSADRSNYSAKINSIYDYKSSFFHNKSNEKLTALSLEKIMMKGGQLYRDNSKFDFRESQYKMAQAINSTIKNNEISIIEAETGLGKTFAYLIPFLISSLENNLPIVVSTYTKNLQDQLFHKDIKSIINFLNFDCRAVVIKGRNNYICRNRLNRLVKNSIEIGSLSDSELHDLAILVLWASHSKSGDIEECNSFNRKRNIRLWNLVKSEALFCRKNCSKDETCKYSFLVSKVKDCDIVVVNHALLISDSIEGGGLLPKEHYFVIDESHNLFASSKDLLTSSIDKSYFNEYLKDLSAKIKIAQKFPKNIINDAIQNAMTILNDKIDKVASDINDFFATFLASLDEKNNESIYPSTKSFSQCDVDFQDCTPTLGALIESLVSLSNDTRIIINKFSKEDDHLSGIGLLESMSQFNQLTENFKDSMESDSYIKWMKYHSGRGYCTINFLPKDIGGIIYNNYLSMGNTGIFCSATISVDQHFDFFKEQVGIAKLAYDRDINEHIFESPFFLEDQLSFYSFRSELHINSREYIDNIANQIDEISSFYNKRMLVLCTSYKQASQLKNSLTPRFKSSDRHLFVHERGRSKNSLIRSFKANSGSVLIGTLAFWEGIDLPRSELSIVMMLRIPFSNPNDPYFNYISNQLSYSGHNAFDDYQVPEACLKMKQGFGRLIRTEYDSGIFILTDPRIYNSSYGYKLLNSFPIEPIEYNHFTKIISDKKNL